MQVVYLMEDLCERVCVKCGSMSKCEVTLNNTNANYEACKENTTSIIDSKTKQLL